MPAPETGAPEHRLSSIAVVIVSNSKMPIDVNTMNTYPNLVVVNFDTSPGTPEGKYDGTFNSLQVLDLGSQEISAMRRAKNFTWLNIKENEWVEICGGPNCPSEAMNRNIHDYLKLQMELWTADCATRRNKLKSNLTVNQRAQNSLKERCDKRLLKRPLRSEGEINFAIAQINASEKRGIWFKICESLESFFEFSNAAKTRGGIVNAVQKLLLYFGVTLAAFILLIPMTFTEEEYRKMKRVPESILTIMSWINSHLAFLPISKMITPPPPPPSPWYYTISKYLWLGSKH
ncbi:unnamed protein product [Allacma fusca]|uniref:Uncharacterized protein n=1 Tax=Allacma fusca TaxID=39272 RepID=A0A8J2NQB4_9HEXA|nr:unnamed protein product [Allacma fusca]